MYYQGNVTKDKSFKENSGNDSYTTLLLRNSVVFTPS